TLKVEDIPSTQRQASEAILDIQRSLQLAGIYASTGDGEMRAGAIAAWAEENAVKLDAMMEYWKPPVVTPSSPVAVTPGTATLTVTAS
ncbi:MAG TPA: hypothetical protein VEA38_03845, partial [Terriglobales bacterium]|nr:hypothetical protein [Terriglobales bacterium]